jgi:putative transcriptional regulator
MKKKPSRLTDNLIEMGEDLRDLKLIDEDTYQKVTIRLLKKEKKVLKVDPITSEEIRIIREREHLSQAAFASYLNLSVGYLSKLERGLRKPTGPLLTLLSVVQRKGLDTII